MMKTSVGSPTVPLAVHRLPEVAVVGQDAYGQESAGHPPPGGTDPAGIHIGPAGGIEIV